MKIGIIREEKSPQDSRVTLSPQHCKTLIGRGYDIVVQPSGVRCFKDSDYTALGVPLQEDLNDRTILIGVKEVPISSLIADKTYFFFSHTIKEQVYNRDLLLAVIEKNITLIDYEVLTDPNGARVIAFGKFAGMVGAHNGIWAYGNRTGLFSLPRMKDLYDYSEAQEIYKSIQMPNIKVVITGTGRVAQGAVMVLKDMGLKKVRPIDFVQKQFDMPVLTQLSSFYWARRKDEAEFDDVQDFYKNPQDYESDFEHFLPMTDIMVNSIFWDNKAPAFFTLNEMANPKFGIKVIADVTCDIAPVSSIPSTIRASTIEDPVFGYDPHTMKEVKPYLPNAVDMMTVDNLPNELPRDASAAFGDMFIEHIIPELEKPKSRMLSKATVATEGQLGSHFKYLKGYLKGKE